MVLIVGLLGGGDAVGRWGTQGQRFDGPVVLDTDVATKKMISLSRERYLEYEMMSCVLYTAV